MFYLWVYFGFYNKRPLCKAKPDINGNSTNDFKCLHFLIVQNQLNKQQQKLNIIWHKMDCKLKSQNLLLLIEMGNSSQNIEFECGAKYIGTCQEGLLHGEGQITLPQGHALMNKRLKRNKSEEVNLKVKFDQGTITRIAFETEAGFTYEGQIDSLGELNGEAELRDKDGVKYLGTFQNGKLKKGTIENVSDTSDSQILYRCSTAGQYIGTSIITGPGFYHNLSDEYLAEGQFYKGNLTAGIYVFPNGDVYEGEFSQGYPCGSGCYLSSQTAAKRLESGSASQSLNKNKQLIVKNQKKRNHSDGNQFSYTGNFSNKQPSGKGKVQFSNGDNFEGKLKSSLMQGYGEYTYSDGTVYKGNFHSGEQNGECQIEFKPSSLINRGRKSNEMLEKYEGQISNGVFHGLGVLYFENGVIFKGYFLEGAKNGPGVLIYGRDKYKCLYMMNRLVGDLKVIVDEQNQS